MDSGFFEQQVGALIRLDTGDDPVNLAAATKKEIHYRGPGSASGSWTATLDGTKLTYTTTQTTDLPVAGRYYLQVYLEGPGWKLHGAIVEMVVGQSI